MSMERLRDAFLAELKDSLSFERQLIDAMPRLIEHASNPELRKALEHHLQETREQAERVGHVFEVLGENVAVDRCEAMNGLIEEAEKMARREADEMVRDALLISLIQKIEHYEIAHYGTLCAWAEQIGLPDDALHPLQATLDEEKNGDASLQRLAVDANRMAVAH